MALTQESERLAKILIDGAQLTFRNADELFSEAQLLASHGAVARAYLLHQISMEECGKIDMITAAVMELLRGEAVDMKRLSKAFTHHGAKNRTNAYFLPVSEQEEIAINNGDMAGSHEAFKVMQKEFHTEANNRKNASLYVDFNEKFSSPSEAITQDHLNEIRQRNAEFMILTKPKIAILDRWNQNLAAASVEMSELSEALGLHRLAQGTPEDSQTVVQNLAHQLQGFAKALNTKKPSSN